MYRNILAFIGLSLVNPLCMFASFSACMYLGVYQRVGTAEEQFDARFFPVYLTIGMFVLLLQLFVAYGVARIVHRGGARITMADVTRAFLFAQKPFYFFIVAVPVLMTKVEGNAIVFGAFFAFPFVVVASVFAILRMRRSLRTLAGEPAVSNKGDSSPTICEETASIPRDWRDGVMTAIAGTFALAVIASLLVVWRYGPANMFGEWLAWRSDTPQYAANRILDALRTGNARELESYVDVDAILSQFAPLGGPRRADFEAALEKRQLVDESQQNIAFKEWRSSLPCNVSQWLQERNGRFAVEMYIDSEVTGQLYPLVFCMKMEHDKYRITGVDNLEQIAAYHKQNEEIVRKNAALADEAKAKAKPLVEFRLLRIMQKDDTSQCTFSVTNKGTVPIEDVACVILFKRSDTGAIVASKLAGPNFYNAPLRPGQTKSIDDFLDALPDLARRIETKRLAVADVFPAIIRYADGRRVDLVTLPE